VPRSAKLHAVVLRTVDYGERDRVVTLLSRERGKLSAFARGARSSRRRFGGVLEPFTLVTAEVTERGGDLWALESASAERGFGTLRADLARIACASYAVELSRELLRDAEPHEDLFDALVAYLVLLDEGPARPWDLRRFELDALRAAGLQPSLVECARCGRPAGAGPARFDPVQGGVLCADCAPTAGPGTLAVRPEVLAALRSLQRGEPASGGGPEGAEARTILGACIELHLGKRLQARRFLDEVGPMLS
jgi:DNA repair protein RecO (recombination protein O)